MSFDRKIQLGFATCTFVLIIVAVVSFNNGEKFLESNEWVSHTQEVINEFDQVLINSIEIENGSRGFIISGDPKFLDPFNKGQMGFKEHIGIVSELTLDNAAQQKRIERIRILSARQVEFHTECSELRRKDFESAATLLSSGRSKEILDSIRAQVNNAIGLEQKLLAERRVQSNSDVSTFNSLFILLLVVIMIALIIVYVIIVLNLRALRKAEAETADKNKSLSGIEALMNAIQGNQTLTQLGSVILQNLTSQLDVPLGVLYMTERNSRTLRLIGSQAVDQRSLKQVISFGEGLAGQCAHERKIILLRDIQDDHFDVRSSFGNVKPKTILAVPLIFENAVMGVVELGSLTDFNEKQKEYLQYVSNNIAISLMASLVREEAQALLDETQRQAEELEAQQDELRAVNDELTSKTELLQKSENELMVQQEELEQSNVELEEKANMLEEQKNSLEHAKEEIQIKVKEIETTSRYKSEFLANMSHELRTPLNSILILSQLLSTNRSKALTEKDVEYARNIHNSGTDLLNLINEILDLAKIESGKLQLDISEFPLSDMTETLYALFSEVALRNGIKFRIDVDQQLKSAVLATDRQRIDQVLKNLLSNAFKFTDRNGSVTLSIRPEKDAGAGSISFAVADTGIGIPQDKFDTIFEAFQQADGSTKRKYGGTGLGLSISRELAQALGGSISLKSKSGEGSTFTLTVPQLFDSSLSVSTEREVEVKKPVRPVRELEIPQKEIIDIDAFNDDRKKIGENDRVILIMEDDPAFSQVLLDFVRERNYKGIVAHQGNTGLSYARHYKPDAILLDINLPVMDGIEALRLMKNDPELRHIPVQIISSYDQQKRPGLAMGALDYTMKPVSENDLKRIFDRLESFRNKKLKKLLIVEDNKQQNDAIRELIGNGDVKCHSAYRGKDAYQMLDEEFFDCLILDLGLPDMSGIELLEKIRMNSKMSKIPIIVYTGKDLKKEDAAVLNKLADTVVLKTADSQERLLDETSLFLHRVESRLPKEKQKIIRKLHRTDELLKGKKILLVDDDIRNIYSLTNVFEEEGIDCITAENGKVALEELDKNPGIDLVLMDIMMPEMDGYEATMEIRKTEAFKKLPIIALTAKAMKGDKEKCLAAGMSDYISKPVNIDQLLSLMRVWLYK